MPLFIVLAIFLIRLQFIFLLDKTFVDVSLLKLSVLRPGLRIVVYRPLTTGSTAKNKHIYL